MSDELVCGIDLGTSAVRAVVTDRSGKTRGSGACVLPPVSKDGPRREQDAQVWWQATVAALRDAVDGIEASAVGVIAVDGTSGTFVAVDDDLEPLGPGLMYNDARAVGYGETVNTAAAEFVQRHGYLFRDDFALPRMLWLRDHDASFDRTRAHLHQADFINARLIGDVPATDWSNALKTGCDLFSGGWGGFIGDKLAFPMDKLPAEIVAPGTTIGRICIDAAEVTGLAAGTLVAAGASDGTAALLASGAGRVGDFNSALGTTLVLKGITAEPLRDPEGVVYCHRHPDGPWLPGGASNVGGAAVGNGDLRKLDDAAAAYLPCPVLTYPLSDSTHERFPFRRDGIEAFFTGGEPSDDGMRHAALLQGVAFVERWCYEKLESLGASVDRIFSTGGGSRSDAWTQLRADVLDRSIARPADTETARGAAILAASAACGGVGVAGSSMVRVERRFEPGGRNFDDLYGTFRDECHRRWGVA